MKALVFRCPVWYPCPVAVGHTETVNACGETIRPAQRARLDEARISRLQAGKCQQVCYHFVWIPKRRKKVLVGAVAKRLEEICAEVAHEYGWTILKLAIQPDHVHMFVEAAPEERPHEIVRAFKRRLSRILREEFPHLLKLPSLWTHAYFCRTAGNVSAAVIERYIRESNGQPCAALREQSS